MTWARISGRKTLADGESIPLYTAGMRFVGLSEDGASNLMSLVERLGREETAREDDRRAHVRFHIGSPGTARLSFPTDYRVRTISLCGMLMRRASPGDREAWPRWFSPCRTTGASSSSEVVACQPTEGLVKRLVTNIGIEFIDLGR